MTALARRPSLRSQVLLLTAVLSLPLVLLLAWFLVTDLRHKREDAQDQVKSLAEAQAVALSTQLQGMASALQGLAARPELRTLDPKVCDPVLSLYATLDPQFNSLALRDVKGQLRCSAQRPAPSTPVSAPTAWSEAALQKAGLSAGGASSTGTAGGWFSPLAVAVTSDSGTPLGLLQVEVDLHRASQVWLSSVPKSALLTVIGPDRLILMRSSGGDSYIGKPASPEALRQTQGLREGFVSVLGMDGVQRLNYFVTLPDLNWRVVAGMPEQALYAPYRTRLWSTIAATATALLLVMALAWRIGRNIIEPISALARSTAQIAGGDSRARAALLGPPELCAVAEQLNHFLDANQQAAQALLDSEERYRRLLEDTPDLVTLIDPQGHFIFLNGAAQTIFGLPAQECLGLSAYTFVHPDDLSASRQAAQAWLNAHTTALGYENRQVSRDGTVRWLQWTVRAHRNAKGELTGVSAIGRDVTRQHEQARLLREAQALAHIGNWTVDLQSGARTWSEETYRLYGLTPGVDPVPPQGPPYLDLLHPDDRERMQAWFADCAAGRQPGPMEFRTRPQHGKFRWLLGHGGLECSPNGEAKRMIGMVQDISERKRAESSLLGAEKRTRMLIEAANVGLWEWDLHTHAIYLSPECKQALGYGDDKAPNFYKEWQEHLHPHDRPATVALAEACRLGEREGFDAEARLLHHSGGWRWFFAHAELSRNAAGQPERIVGSLIDITERRESELALEASEARFQSAFDHSATGMALVALDGSWLKVNAQLCAMFGYTEAELLAMSFKDLSHPEDLRADMDDLQLVLDGTLASYTMSKRYFHKDGHLVWGLLSVAPVCDRAGNLVCLVTQVNDISKQKRTEQALSEGRAMLRETAQHTQAILDNMLDGVITIDHLGKIASFNRAASQIFGYVPDEVLGKNVSLLMPEPHRSHHDGYLRMHLETRHSSIIGKPRELEGQRKDGSRFPMVLSVSELEHGGKLTFVGLVRDITVEREHADEVHRLAFYDPLTALPNRRLLHDRLKQAMLTANRSGQHAAALLLDLDHFKLLNDSQGHEVGDRLLKQVAQRLSQCVHEGDSVARLGGDEFVLLLEGLGFKAAEAANEAEAMAIKIMHALQQPFDLGGVAYGCTPSIGIVVFMEDGDSPDEVLKKADVAMYQAKANGRNTVRFFDPAMQSAVDARADLEHDMRNGLERGEFLLHYQLQVDRQGKPVGAEALVRWKHPERGMVSPAQFIPLAEETHLILPLGQWVLETACAQLLKWADDPATAQWSMAVNVSALQFSQKNFVSSVAAALVKSGANPYLLKLELTESMLVGDVEDVIAKMNAIKAFGVSFSLDDFGTGYSSLSFLKRLPLDQLKIDQSFVRDVLTDPNDVVIARTILALGLNLGLKVIAEGVENEGQLNVLTSIGCTLFQGYHFARPMLAQDLPTQLLTA